jgi:hypothetical protein
LSKLCRASDIPTLASVSPPLGAAFDGILAHALSRNRDTRFHAIWRRSASPSRRARTRRASWRREPTWRRS